MLLGCCNTCCRCFNRRCFVPYPKGPQTLGCCVWLMRRLSIYSSLKASQFSKVLQLSRVCYRNHLTIAKHQYGHKYKYRLVLLFTPQRSLYFGPGWFNKVSRSTRNSKKFVSQSAGAGPQELGVVMLTVDLSPAPPPAAAASAPAQPGSRR